MKNTFVVAGLLLAVAVSGCNKTGDWSEVKEGLAKANAQRDADAVRKRAELRADEAEEAAEETNRQLRKINEQLWWRNMTR